MVRPVLKSLVSRALRAIDGMAPPDTAHAHCDIPCGIYDPHLLQLAALTMVRMNQLIDALESGGQEKSAWDTYMHQMSRYTTVKEEHAELLKREVRIIYGDYFKPEHAEKYPELKDLVWNLLKLGSKARQGIDMQAAQDALTQAHRFAEIFWETKGVATKKQPSNQAAGGEFVVPAN
jgi:nickel superoxide dismutase